MKQSTFDAIVREAIEDFGLAPDEALVEAREQLRKAGITDFSNISNTSPSVPDQQHHGVVLPRKLEEALESFDQSALVDVLTTLVVSANENREVAGVAGANSAVHLLSEVLQKAVAAVEQQPSYEPLVRVSCHAVAALCATDEVNRTKFVAHSEYDGIASLIKLLPLLARTAWTSDDSSCPSFELSTYTSVTTAIASVQRQNEKVKRRIAAGDSLDHLLCLLDRTARAIMSPKMQSQQDETIALFSKICVIVRQMLSADDTTSLVPETFNRARIISGSKTVTESGLRPLTYSSNVLQLLHSASTGVQASASLSASNRRRILTDSVHTARLAAVSDEICAKLMELQFHTVAFSSMNEFSDSTQLVQVCMAFLKNLAGRDQCKTPIFQSIAIVQQVADIHLPSSPKVAEQFCALLSSLCLRRTDISKKVVLSGIVNKVSLVMGAHSDACQVQRAGCLAIRNMCARDEEIRKKLRSDPKVETAIRRARKLFPVECEEVAYSALRDLDVLIEEELRQDKRYTMPAGFCNLKIVRSGS